MLIDFHVHTYDEKIAKRVVKQLIDVGNIAKAETDGTVENTAEILKAEGVDYAVNLPIATKQAHSKLLNKTAEMLKRDKYWKPFGTVLPTGEPFGGRNTAGYNYTSTLITDDSDDGDSQKTALESLEEIKSYGLFGVKLHPDYQGFFLFEERLFPIWERAGELGLPVMIHIGHDPVSTYLRHSAPSQLAYIAEKFPKTTFIGAHLGGMFAWQETAHYLASLKNVFVDTAIIAKWCPTEMCEFIIQKLGSEKVLFGTDCPFSSVEFEKSYIENLNISSNDKDKIFYKNALELLNI